MFGGEYDATTFLDSTRLYDFDDETWTELPPMPDPSAFIPGILLDDGQGNRMIVAPGGLGLFVSLFVYLTIVDYFTYIGRIIK